jgi:hypothetical protein
VPKVVVEVVVVVVVVLEVVDFSEKPASPHD